MSGYDGYSKSNNAVAAEHEGRFPLARAAKIARVPTELVTRFIRAREWHHVSGWYNRVDYYSVAEIEMKFGKRAATAAEIEDGMDYAVDPAAVAALSAYDPPKTAAVTRSGCTVEWIEWSGSRHHPHATERRAEGCSVTIKGRTATIALPDGTTLVKRIGTRGFTVTNPNAAPGHRLVVANR